jgi:hypothetical protein
VRHLERVLRRRSASGFANARRGDLCRLGNRRMRSHPKIGQQTIELLTRRSVYKQQEAETEGGEQP